MDTLVASNPPEDDKRDAPVSLGGNSDYESGAQKLMRETSDLVDKKNVSQTYEIRAYADGGLESCIFCRKKIVLRLTVPNGIHRHNHRMDNIRYQLHLLVNWQPPDDSLSLRHQRHRS